MVTLTARYNRCNTQWHTIHTYHQRIANCVKQARWMCYFVSVSVDMFDEKSPKQSDKKHLCVYFSIDYAPRSRCFVTFPQFLFRFNSIGFGWLKVCCLCSACRKTHCHQFSNFFYLWQPIFTLYRIVSPFFFDENVHKSENHFSFLVSIHSHQQPTHIYST